MKNIKVLYLIFICLYLLSLLSCDAWDKTAQQYLESSQSYYDRGEMNASLIEIKNALQKNPMNPEFHLFAAKIYLKLGQGKDAEIQLSKASSLGIDQSRSLPLMSHALFQQRRYQELLNVQIPEGLHHKELATVYAYQGFAAAESQKPELANTLYKQSIAQDPDNRPAYRGIALLYSAAGEYAKAISLVQKLIEKQPSNAELRSLLGDLFVGDRQFDQAVASYTKAIEFEKDKQFPYLAKRAIACISKNDIDCVTDDLSVLQEQARSYYMTDYVKGLLAIKQQRWNDAESALSGALLSNTELTPAYYFSGLSHFQQKHYDSAINQLVIYVAREPESDNGRHLLSLSQLKAGHLESARSTLLPLIKSEYIESTILYLLGQIEYQLGNISDSIRYFKTLSERHPESAVAHTQLGLKLLSKGEINAGQGELAIAIDIKPDLMEAGQASVLAFLESGQFQQAQNLIEKLRKQGQDSAVLDNLQGVLYLQQREITQASDYFKKALTKSPGDPNASNNLANLLYRQGKINAAMQVYQTVLVYHPSHIQSHLKLAQIELKQGQSIRAESRLLKVIDSLPDALGPRLMLANYYLISGRVDTVSELLQPMIKLYPDDPRLLQLVAESLLASGRPGQAKHEALILVNKVPDSVKTHWLLARAAFADGDVFKGKQALKQVLSIEPQHVPAQIINIKLLVKKGKNKSANKALKQLLNHATDDPRVTALTAWLASNKGDYKKAVNLYQKVFSKSASSANALALSGAQWQAGLREQSLQTLKKWTFNHPDDPKTQFTLATRYQSMGLDGEAGKRYQRVLRFEPGNVAALNNLAWLLRHDDTGKALDYIERAADLAPGKAAIQDTLGVILMLAGESQRAQRVLQRAANAHPEHVSIQYHLARAYDKNDEPQQAIAILQKLLSRPDDFSEKTQARRLMKQLKSSTTVSG